MVFIFEDFFAMNALSLVSEIMISSDPPFPPYLSTVNIIVSFTQGLLENLEQNLWCVTSKCRELCGVLALLLLLFIFFSCFYFNFLIFSFPH